MITTLGHTDAFIDLAEGGGVAGGALVGHLDTSRIVWIGHSRGGEGVVEPTTSYSTGTHVRLTTRRQDIRLIIEHAAY